MIKNKLLCQFANVYAIMKKRVNLAVYIDKTDNNLKIVAEKG